MSANMNRVTLQRSGRNGVSRTHGRCRMTVRAVQETLVSTRVVVKEHGAYSVKGTVRKINEDRYDVKVLNAANASAGDPVLFAGVYDGHGGSATADWLKSNLFGLVSKTWQAGNAPEASITDAYLEADKNLLVSKGFMGLGERGIGGSKCGATGVNVLLYKGADCSTTMLTANVGDARILLIRGGKAVELTEEHVPDMEAERVRIERQNPNPKMPMVRYVGGTWRVGGLLALSRAFGDAYLKGSLQFEGIISGSDGYSSGFGVIAEPFTTVNTLTDADSWVVLASDGLFAEEARGGGGGLDNDTVAELCMAAGSATKPEQLAKTLTESAAKVGSTDDITVVCLRLGSA